MRWLLKRWLFWGGAGFMLVAICAGYLLIALGFSKKFENLSACTALYLAYYNF